MVLYFTPPGGARVPANVLLQVGTFFSHSPESHMESKGKHAQGTSPGDCRGLAPVPRQMSTPATPWPGKRIPPMALCHEEYLPPFFLFHVLPFSPSLHHVPFPVPCAGSCPQDTPEFWPPCFPFMLYLFSNLFPNLFSIYVSSMFYPFHILK